MDGGHNQTMFDKIAQSFYFIALYLCGYYALAYILELFNICHIDVFSFNVWTILVLIGVIIGTLDIWFQWTKPKTLDKS
jgi:hypothetical protein